MRLLVTGGAGFVGSNFCDAALARGHEVLCFDDFSTGHEQFLAQAKQSPRFSVVRGNIQELGALREVVTPGTDWVVHFAANADVRKGAERPRRDLEINTLGTWNVLEATRQAGVRHLLFTSTGSVYGEPKTFPTPEDAPFPEQTSLYGASKLAAEGMISAYCHAFDMSAVVFRMVSVLGPRYSHGHVFDFIQKLRRDPTELEVLGDGSQVKSYLHVEDLVRGFWACMEGPPPGYNVFNIGHDDALAVRDSVKIITERLGLAPKIRYTGGTRGWVGDSPRIQLATSRVRARGWTTRHGLVDAVRDTVDYLVSHPSLLEAP